MMTLLAIEYIHSAADPLMMNGEVFFYNQIVSRQYVTTELEKKNQIINELKAKEAELLQAADE